MKPLLHKLASDGSEQSSRSSETPPQRRKWPGRITSKLSIAAMESNPNKAQVFFPEPLSARSDSSSDKSLSCSSLESGEEEEEEVEDWFTGDDEEVADWLEETDELVVHHLQFDYHLNP
jgi:hypothetical protein